MSNKFTGITSGANQIPVYDKEAHSALSGKQDKLTIYGYNGHITHINSSAISAAKSIEAGYAGYAYNDSQGHSITSTYVPNSALDWHENELVYLTGVSGYPISAANAEYAQEAGEAYNDTNGHPIHTTYAPNSAFSFSNNYLDTVSGKQIHANMSTFASTADIAWSDSNGNRIDNTYVPKSNFSFKNSTACSAISGRPLIAKESEYAQEASEATKAHNDGNGDSITATYVPKSALQFHGNYLDVVSGKRLFADIAGLATTADYARRDINGNAIENTYQPKLGYSGNSDGQGIYLNSNNLYVQQYDGQNRNNVYGYVNGTTLQSHAYKQQSIYAGIKGQNWSVTAGPSLMSLSGYISAHEGSWSGSGSGSVASPSGTIYVSGSNIESTDKVLHDHVTSEYNHGGFECNDGWIKNMPIHYFGNNKTIEITFDQIIPAGTVVTMENYGGDVVLTLTTSTATSSVKFSSTNGNIGWWEQGDYAYIYRHDNVTTSCTVIERNETKQIADVMVESELEFDSGNNITGYAGSAFCGSALPISAGQGIKLELVNNTLVASTSGYVWTSASLFHTNSPVTQTTYTLSDSCSNYDKLEVDFYDVNNVRTVMDCPIPPNLATSGTRGGYFSVVPEGTSTTSVIWFKAFNWSAANTTWTCYCSEISAKGGSSTINVNANQPDNPPKVINIIGWKRVGGN